MILGFPRSISVSSRGSSQIELNDQQSIQVICLISARMGKQPWSLLPEIVLDDIDVLDSDARFPASLMLLSVLILRRGEFLVVKIGVPVAFSRLHLSTLYAN